MCPFFFSNGQHNTSVDAHQAEGQVRRLLSLLLPRPPRFYHVVGHVIGSIMQPSEAFRGTVCDKWRRLAECRHIVALQIRRGPRELGWYRVLDERGEEQVLRCGRRVAHDDSCFVVISDDLAARRRIFLSLTGGGSVTCANDSVPHSGLDRPMHQGGRSDAAKGAWEVGKGVLEGVVGGKGPARVMYEEALLLYSGMDHNQKVRSEAHLRLGMDGAFGDWFVIMFADDAVLSDASSFGYTAFAASHSFTNTLPVTVRNDDAPNASQPTARRRDPSASSEGNGNTPTEENRQIQTDSDTDPHTHAAWRSTSRGRCERRVWGAHTYIETQTGSLRILESRPFKMVNSAERFFPAPPPPVEAAPRDPNDLDFEVPRRLGYQMGTLGRFCLGREDA